MLPKRPQLLLSALPSTLLSPALVVIPVVKLRKVVEVTELRVAGTRTEKDELLVVGVVLELSIRVISSRALALSKTD